MFGFWNSASPISAAFFIDCAATPALPAADSGRIRPTLTWPLPTDSGCCCGPAGPASGCDELNGLENWPSDCCTPAQAPSSGAPRIRPTAVRRVVSQETGPADPGLRLCGPTIVSLLLTDQNRPGHRPRSQRRIQPYCRRMVNQIKRIMVPRQRCRLQEPALLPLSAALSLSLGVRSQPHHAVAPGPLPL